jgi:hypothetical protein
MTDKPRPPLKHAGGFEKRLDALPKGTCQCWTCLRSRGLTPPRALADRHVELVTGKIHRTDNGAIDTQANTQRREREEAEKSSRKSGMTKGRGKE